MQMVSIYSFLRLIPYIILTPAKSDPMDPTAGYYPYFTDGPAYSTNYADHRHIPAYLLEIHAPKPFKQRVLGAYSWIGGILKIVGEKADSLREAIDTDRNSRISPVPIAWDYVTPAPIVDFDIYNYSIKKNDILGIDQIIYTDEPITIQVEQSDRCIAFALLCSGYDMYDLTKVTSFIAELSL